MHVNMHAFSSHVVKASKGVGPLGQQIDGGNTQWQHGRMQLVAPPVMITLMMTTCSDANWRGYMCQLTVLVMLHVAFRI